MKRHTFFITACLLLASLFIIPITNAHAQTSSVVRAVLFYSPTCGHCEYVITEVLPPLVEKYGEQLQIIGIDVTQPQGQELYQAARQKFNVENRGVPLLVIGDRYLIGSVDIPEQLPGLIEVHMSQGGVDWPDIPGLREVIAVSPTEAPTLQATPIPDPVFPESTSPTILPSQINITWQEKFAQDPSGNTLAVLILAGMLAAVVWAVVLFKKANGISLRGRWSWTIPILCVIGFGVAGYLAYVETAQVTAVCGPVGDCNTVQQSEYARLFGILPIGVLGLAGYVTIIIAWLVARFTTGRLADLAGISLFIMPFFGTLFSIYLTFLEPFVIGATCAWCLTSAVLMTVLMLLTIGPAKLAFSRNPFATFLRRKHKQLGVHDG